MRPALLFFLFVACKPPAPTTICPETPDAAPMVCAIPFDLPKAGDIVALPPPPAPPGVHTPEAVTGVPMAVILSGVITKTGDRMVDGRALAPNQSLVQVAKDAKSRDPSVRATIMADRDATWAMVIRALDELKQGGIGQLAFAVEAAPAR